MELIRAEIMKNHEGMKILQLNTDFNFDEYQAVEGEKITYKGDERVKQAVNQHQ